MYCLTEDLPSSVVRHLNFHFDTSFFDVRTNFFHIQVRS